MVLFMHQPNKDPALLNELFESGKVTPVIDRSYPLNNTAEALRRLGEGNTLGKVVVTVWVDKWHFFVGSGQPIVIYDDFPP